MTTNSDLGDEASTNLEQAEISVLGMHCGSCVALVEEAFLDHDGVTSATVDLQGETAVVRFDPARTTIQQLRAVITEVGYQTT